MTAVLEHLYVCSNCYQFAANGFDGMDLTAEEEGAIVEGWAGLARRWDRPVHVGPWSAGDSETSFSWDRCEICDALPGMRHIVAVLTA